ncbi:P-loop containing nucleoside triphosphate hydrolase protein [Mycena amicta]|nr:P-loop containing nucleoside triphosphate hydrolase protein [Mycena amicta]
MSSDYEFDDDFSLNDAAIQEIDAIERLTQTVAPPSPKSDDDFTFGDIDESELARIDNFIEASYNGTAQPVAGPSRLQQTTLYGDVLPPQEEEGRPVARAPFGRQPSKTKKWDQTKFLKTGQKKRRANGKRGGADNDSPEEEVEFEQYPAPFITRPPPPMKLRPDLLEAKHWVYPLNHPKRSYQYNIVKHCLFDNTIVALPTGLGKTFVAGVVMLNYYRWFPDGKVVFVAPTKPLVSQQIEACHKTCGIPGSDAIELTGENPVAMRARSWKDKRVFYMTPQTLFNDLEKETCDAKDIVLIVIDEAHRATGEYAYTKVVRYMMAKNPHFRVLALTATPGSKPEAVQDLINSLHVSRIEIRDEDSIDIQPYIHQKKVERHIIVMSEDVDKIKNPLKKLMDSYISTLRSQGVPDGAPFNALTLHPHRPQAMAQTLSRAVFQPLQHLSRLARGMGYLLEGTIGMCNTYLQTIAANEPDENGKTVNGLKSLVEKPLFKEIMKELDTQRLRGFSLHPKMDALKRIIIDHFGQNLGEEGEEPEPTKVMVFLSFREGVEEVVQVLNSERPLIRAHAFIGQGKDKKGVRGLTQKEQLEVIRKFKTDELNVLVSTSIGEEGLDIGEVDLIVCYDTQSTPIRMLQRFGRTGRKRNGVIHALLSQGREETTIDKAKDKQRLVHGAIIRGDQLELYGDVERLLPDHIHPECLEQVMDIQEYVRDDGKSKKRTSSRDANGAAKGTKRKRNDDPSRNIPTGAVTGFLSASKLRVKGAKLQKVDSRTLEERGEDDDLDRELEAGVVGLLHRSVSADASTSVAPPKGKTTLRRAATEGTKQTTKKKPGNAQAGSSKSKQAVREKASSKIADAIFEDASVIDIASDSEDSSPSRPAATAESDSSHNNPKADVAWLLDDDDDPDIEIVDSSPRKTMQRSPTPPSFVRASTLSSKATGKRRESTPVETAEPMAKRIKSDMPPPPLPAGVLSSPQSSFPVRAPGRGARVNFESSPQVESPPVRRRLHRRGAIGTTAKTKPDKARAPRGLYDMEAIHSGDEVSQGESGSDDEESESDRQFLKDIPNTQVSPSYDQSMVYRQSLLTQMPGRGPQFANRPIRQGLFGGGLSEIARKQQRATISNSSPPREDSEPDEYAIGSFVVADDSFLSSDG